MKSRREIFKEVLNGMDRGASANHMNSMAIIDVLIDIREILDERLKK